MGRYSDVRHQQLKKYVVDEKTNCWNWSGGKDKDGYGKLKRNGVDQRAHRLFYQEHKEPIPEGYVVLHSCDNPSCVNPAHLSAGTHLDNEKDKDNKGRRSPSPSLSHPEKIPRGESHPRFGKKMPESIAAALLKSNLGRSLSAEHKQKLSKFTPKEVVEIREDPRPEAVIAKEKNVTQSTINRIKRKLRYKDI